MRWKIKDEINWTSFRETIENYIEGLKWDIQDIVQF